MNCRLRLVDDGDARDTYDWLGFGFAPLPLGSAIALATVADRSGRMLRWLGTAAGIAVSRA